MTVAENLLLDRVGSVARSGLIDRKRMRARALELMREFDIQAAGPDAPFGSLSGGNQQRVVLARELGHHPTVLVAAQPTRGLDVGAIEYMSSRLRAAAERGIAVLLISTELEEILELSHRIVVLSGGAVVGELDRHDNLPRDRHPDYPELLLVTNIPKPNGKPSDSKYTGQQWHSDMSFTPVPSLGSLLRGITIPPVGTLENSVA